MIMYLLIYAVLGVLHLAAEFGQFTMVSMLTKVLLMPTLVIYLWQTIGLKGSARFILIGLVFSWFGDIFLMFPRDEYSESLRKTLFLCGLVSFLIAHIQYIIAFIKDIHPYPKASILIEKPFWVIPFLLYILCLLLFLAPHTSRVGMTFPICIYAVTIMIMCLAAFNRKNIVSERSFRLVFVGAVLFVLSDSLIALTVFYQHFEYDRIAIMFTYIAAQLCITYGYVLNKQQPVAI
jgi:uncharacterized membrane protein YhhN